MALTIFSPRSTADRQAATERDLRLFYETRILPRGTHPLDETKYAWGQLTGADQNLADVSSLAVKIEAHPGPAAEKTVIAAEVSRLPTLARFTTERWLPEEREHPNGLGLWLIKAGYRTQDYLEYEMKTVRSTTREDFFIGRGFTALQVSIYSMVQELLTAHFYFAGYLYNQSLGANSDPTLGRIFSDLFKQEFPHFSFYRGAVRIMWKHNPDKDELKEALAGFVMPTRVYAPEYPTDYAGQLGKRVGFKTGEVVDILREEIVSYVGHSGLAKIAFGYGQRQPSLPLKAVAYALTPLAYVPVVSNGAGHLLVKASHALFGVEKRSLEDSVGTDSLMNHLDKLDKPL